MREDQIDRYSRQIVLPEVGGKGQKRLLEAHVLLVGAGGLGAPILTYLVAAGVGDITVMDPDHVERSNLHRQTLFGESHIGQGKARVAREVLSGRNPDVTLHDIPERFSPDTDLEAEPGRPHVIVDGSDNFETKFAVSDTAVKAEIPAVLGGISRHLGQVMSVLPGTSACYRCLFEEPPPENAVPDCSEAGVLGPLAGTIGSLQAYETLKILLGFGSPLFGTVLEVRPVEMSFRTVPVSRNEECPTCFPEKNR